MESLMWPTTPTCWSPTTAGCTGCLLPSIAAPVPSRSPTSRLIIKTARWHSGAAQFTNDCIWSFVWCTWWAKDGFTHPCWEAESGHCAGTVLRQKVGEKTHNCMEKKKEKINTLWVRAHWNRKRVLLYLHPQIPDLQCQRGWTNLG